MRGRQLQQLINAAEAAISQTAAATDAKRTARAVFDRLSAREGEARNITPCTVPLCDHLTNALSAATGPRAHVAAAFSVITSCLAWRRRASADPSNVPFYDGHANAMLFGPGGLEEREDVWVGATLMAPGVVYVDHDHPPEEVCLSLTPGEWWNARMEWTDPGPEGLVYNPPGILHAMRAGLRLSSRYGSCQSDGPSSVRAQLSVQTLDQKAQRGFTLPQERADPKAAERQAASRGFATTRFLFGKQAT